MDKSAWKLLGQIIIYSTILGTLIAALSVTFGTCNTATKMVQDGQNTIYNEYKPSELLKKYEWFKNASAALDSKMATLHMYENRQKSLKESYNGILRRDWARADQEQSNLWETEYLGVKASYNDLAAEYNAQMAKFNYRFCNVGELPRGATEPLPRDFKPYMDK